MLTASTAAATTAAAPWWAVPIATIGGALIGGAASFFGTQAGIDRSQRHAAENLKVAAREQAQLQMDADGRNAATDFLSRVADVLDMILYGDKIDWVKINSDEQATLVRVQVYCDVDIAQLASKLFNDMGMFAVTRTPPDEEGALHHSPDIDRHQLLSQQSNLTDLVRRRLGKDPLQLIG